MQRTYDFAPFHLAWSRQVARLTECVLLCGHNAFYRASQTYGMRCMAKNDGRFIQPFGLRAKDFSPLLCCKPNFKRRIIV